MCFWFLMGRYEFVLFKLSLNVKEQFYGHLIVLNTFLIGRNVFLVVRKQLLFVKD